jgi:hypothetical protein
MKIHSIFTFFVFIILIINYISYYTFDLISYFPPLIKYNINISASFLPFRTEIYFQAQLINSWNIGKIWSK